MTEQFVTAVRFWCVERVTRVTNVLCAVEHTESETSEKVTCREIPRHWAK